MNALIAWLRHSASAIRTIRVRLTLWYVALLAVILVSFSSFLYVNLARNLRAELDQSLGTEARRVVASLDIQDGKPSLKGEFDSQETGAVIALYDPSGTRLIDAGAPRPFLIRAAPLARTAAGQQTLGTIALPDGTSWRVLTMPVIENGHVIGTLQVGRSEAAVGVALSQLMILMAFAVPATLVLAVAGGLFLAGRALDPIDRITRTAEQLGAEDLAFRLGFKGTDEVGRLAATFDRMLERLDRAFRRQRQFTADASHELRTPLALLISQADLALERSRTPGEYRRVLLSMREDAKRMNQLVNDLLTLARADAGESQVGREPLDLNDLTSDVVAAMEPLARARGVALGRGAAESTVVMGDQTRLTQLLLNLIDNALKYTPAGGAVTVSTRPEGKQAILQLADTGVGIPPEHLPHLFERFYRVDPARARAQGGAGLGLAIARWIVESHGGHITVASETGRGTTFTVTLPGIAARPAHPDRPSVPTLARHARG
ncbi:MAG: sensor histidine kinase [Chloroflexota bacterium]